VTIYEFERKEEKQHKQEIVSCNSMKTSIVIRTRLKRDTAKLMQPLYSSGLRLTNASIRLTAAVATP
jgi:hypothetical protein